MEAMSLYAIVFSITRSILTAAQDIGSSAAGPWALVSSKLLCEDQLSKMKVVGQETSMKGPHGLDLH
jgi:hypothetical protein